MTPEHDLLTSPDWDIPLTEDLMTRVRRGVRRRQLLRSAAAAAALLATTGVAALVVTGGPALVTPSTPAPAASSLLDAGPLDGFTIANLPIGTVAMPRDSNYVSPLDREGLHTAGAESTRGKDRATVVMRRYERGVGLSLFVSVIRPTPAAGSTVRPTQLHTWLMAWATSGQQRVATIDVPAGSAQLLHSPGSEVAVDKVVIDAPDHVVITIEGNHSFTPDDLELVARGIHR